MHILYRRTVLLRHKRWAMTKHWKKLQQAIDAALSEFAAAEALSVLPEQEEQHLREAINYFLRCVEVCSERRHAAQKRMEREQRRGGLW